MISMLELVVRTASMMAILEPVIRSYQDSKHDGHVGASDQDS